MEETINQRIERLIYALQMKPSDFVRKIAPGAGEKVYRLFRDDRFRPGYETITDILRMFPQVNPEWLLLGNGTMFREESPPGAEPQKTATSATTITTIEGDFVKRSRIEGVERIEIQITLKP